MSLGYLLARATDTIADTANFEPALRLESLRTLAAIIDGERPALELMRDSFPEQENESERALIESLPLCLDWLNQIDAADREDIRWVLEKITRGQELDIRRFAGRGRPEALATAAELDEYTYLVAGCVGEFWTRVCYRHLRKFSRQSPAEMIALGVRYGKGLQLINILRDAGADLRMGRCYLPLDELSTCDTDASRLLSQPDRARAVIDKWTNVATEHISVGLEYVCAIRSRRVRFATALPALIGARTLALLRGSGTTALTTRVKVSRAEVKKIAFGTALTFASEDSIRARFERLSRDH